MKCPECEQDTMEMFDMEEEKENFWSATFQCFNEECGFLATGILHKRGNLEIVPTDRQQRSSS